MEPTKPKQPLSAYWLFSGNVREIVTKELKEACGGKAKFGDIAKSIKAKWEKLTADEKKEFEGKAAADKERYAAEMKIYLEASDPAQALRKKYHGKMPEKPPSVFELFSRDEAQRKKAVESAGATASDKDITAKLREMWKGAIKEEKEPFEAEYKKRHAQFVKEQKEWMTTPEFAEIEKAEKMQEDKKKAQAAVDEAVDVGNKKRPAKVAEIVVPIDTPMNTRSDGGSTATPKTNSAPAKKSRKSVSTDMKPSIVLEVADLAEARLLNFESMLRNLATRPELLDNGNTSKDLLTALKASGGLVNPAKYALLGQR